MQLSKLDALLMQQPAFRAILQELQTHKGYSQLPPGLDVLQAARPFFVMSLARELERPILYVTGRVNRAYNIAEQLPVWSEAQPVYRFMEPSALFYEYTPWADSTIHARLNVLASLCPPPLHKRVENPVVVASARALMQRTLPVREFRAASRVLKTGAQSSPERLVQHLAGVGYTPTTITTGPGEFSRRGGIIDIFPPHAKLPVRIEFFGDEIDSLRFFDPSTQRSTDQVAQVIIPPAREALPRLSAQVAQRLADWFEQQPVPTDDVASLRPDLDRLSGGLAFPEIEFYLPYLYSHPASLLDYLPPETQIIIDDWEEFRAVVEDIEEQAVQLRQEKEASGLLPPGYPLPYVTWDDIAETLSRMATIHLGENLTTPAGATLDPLTDIFSPGPRFSGQLKTFISYLTDLQIKDEPCVIVTRQAQRLAELWGAEDTYRAPVSAIETPSAEHSLQFVEGALNEGWTLHGPAGPVHVLTDAEIFGWQRPEPRRLRRPRARTPESNFADLQPGDYVVHVEYGIGRFEGLRKRILNGDEREYLVVQYAGTDQLFVPIHQADRLTQYIGSSDRPPQLSRLGSADWSRVKESTRQAVEEIARELLELYARRASVRGYAFSPDTPWQHELEASFPYIETEDQMRVIEEVKRDMESPHPMDRLICGDVGYGKTEVALRAAFKAVMDGKQVAILVPTTVLAQQHFNTFTRRLAPFPVKVEMLSRFRDQREQRSILSDLSEGTIDIVIGTHRLLQPDVVFHDLGLLIIDEEQRFGVTHKEQLKHMRTEVDVLTLTATPIPRTLYMALTGTRDISTIQTAPEERLPVSTHIGVYDARVVKQAILRELERNGQVYFVHNRVQTIQTRARQLRDLVPEARIAIAHGQMDERELESVMNAFAQGEFDVLLCTTIIESGMDIPNTNTLIVDRADWFGLAQLYQLRGRVGRGAVRAFAYFFHPAWNKLTEEAAQRLQTIKEYNDLGAGFHIAMRDLEIRGAGDILGARQSGHIAAVGFHLYTQLLSQAVKRLRAKQPAATTSIEATGPTVTIDLPLQAFIPTDYIPDTALRLQVYRRLANLQELQAIDEVAQELADRFGPVPDAVTGLLYQLKIKLLAERAGATAVGNENGQIYIRLPYLAEVDRDALRRYLGPDVRVSRTAVWLGDAPDPTRWRTRLTEILESLNRQAEPTPQ